MEIRLKREHFVRTSTLKGFHYQSAKRWRVCEDYEIEPVPPGEWFRETPYGREFLGRTRIVSKYSSSRTDKWRKYDPVNDHPDLSLRELAGKIEDDDLKEGFLSAPWARRVLGHTS